MTPYTHKLYICWVIISFDEMYAVTSGYCLLDSSFVAGIELFVDGGHAQI